MSAPTDICADCGHRRDQHGVGPPSTRCNALDSHDLRCECPAFDEGAPKPEPRSDAAPLSELAERLAREMADDSFGGWTDEGRVSCCRRYFRLVLASAPTPAPSRIQAAERAVVEAGERFYDEEWKHTRALNSGPHPVSREPAAAAWKAHEEAIERLRAERARQEESECGVISTALVSPNAYPDEYSEHRFRCTKPRGHVSEGDPEHEGELGKWVWR